MRFAIQASLVVGLWGACIAGDLVGADETFSDDMGFGRSRVYQRQRGEETAAYRHRPGRRRSDVPYVRRPHSPSRHAFHRRPERPHIAHGAWFQRPYPYHLDYYRLRYGGTYEPYYGGGLYGTPQIVAPSLYGYGYGVTPPYPPVPDGQLQMPGPSQP